MALISRIIAPLALCFIAAGAACRDLAGPKAVFSTTSDTVTVYALNGAPPGAPTALYIFGQTTARADASFQFDVAFDIDAAGNVVLLPVRTVASPLTSAHQVGLQTSSSTFDNLTEAPKDGYRSDSTLVVPAHSVIVMQSENPLSCGATISGSATYAKFIVDFVDPVARKMSIRYVMDPNCGFRSFLPGVPTSQ